MATQEDCDAAVMRTADGSTCREQAFCRTGGAQQAVVAVGAPLVAQARDRLHISTHAGSTGHRVRG
jgi:hypothetical protein